ncbi:MAG: homoserine dehydrogenase [Burkholderiaceae bacterium]
MSAAIEPVRVVLAGAGAFGRSLLARRRRLPWLHVVAVVEPDSAAAARARAMLADTGAAVVATLDEFGSPADVLVEATGHVEAAAGHALAALQRDWHLVLVSKELDVTVGPELAARFAERGKVCTPVDGDQPSLLMQLVGWARALGLELLAAGKASEHDFVLDDDGSLSWRDRRVDAGALLDVLAAERGPSVRDGLPARHRYLVHHGLPRRTVADLCEMGVVANALALSPDRPDLHAPLAHPTELADLFQHREHGGLLGAGARIDVFNALRRRGEMSFAGGVFVTVATDDDATWQMLADKGHVVARNGRAAMIANPRHLLGVEAPLNILLAARDSRATVDIRPRPVVTLVAIARNDLPAGTHLEISDPHHHQIGLVHGELRASAGVTDLCPYYLCADRRLARPVAAGQPIGFADFADPPAPLAFGLLRAQAERFAI